MVLREGLRGGRPFARVFLGSCGNNLYGYVGGMIMGWLWDILAHKCVWFMRAVSIYLISL